jgi:hypothetical protein
MSPQHLADIARQQSITISEFDNELIEKSENLPLPIFEKNTSDEFLYNSDIKEVALLEDGISVSEQKAKRDKIQKQAKNRVIIDIAILQNKLGGFKYIVSAEKGKLTQLIKANLKEQYGGQGINLVVISDGSKTIKNRYFSLFGKSYTHILDWYHLQEKVVMVTFN